MQKADRRGMSTDSMPEGEAAQGDDPGTRQRVRSKEMGQTRQVRPEYLSARSTRSNYDMDADAGKQAGMRAPMRLLEGWMRFNEASEKLLNSQASERAPGHPSTVVASF